MPTRYCFIAVLCIFMLAAAACGPKIPREVTGKVTWEGDFKEIQADPEQYEGEFVILGGKIISTENFKEGSEIVVLHYPTDQANRPSKEKESGGRFLVRSDSFIDPEIYSPGKLISVAGAITGSESRTIGAFPYEHPVIEGDMWVWDPREKSFPRFHFGLGIGKTF